MYRNSVLGIHVVLLLLLGGCGPEVSEKFPDGYRPTVFITGSNRGIGLEFARQYAAKGWSVIATARNPEAAIALQQLAFESENFRIEALDVTNEAQILVLADKYANSSIDVLVNNAGIKGELTDLTTPYLLAEFEKVLAVNTFAPLRLSQAFLEPVGRSQMKTIVVMSSHLGSLESAPRWGNKEQGRGLYYATSKTAMNMAMRIFQSQVADRGIKLGLLVPGAVLTDMLRVTGRDTAGATPPNVAVRDMIKTIETLDVGADLVDRHGEPVAW